MPLALPTMDAFSLLKYWKSNRDSGSGSSTLPANVRPATALAPANVRTTTIDTSALRSSTASDSDDDDDEDEDEGSFFDLDFSVGNTADGDDENVVENLDDASSESGEEAASPTSSSDLSVSLSPSDHLFFNGDLLPLEDSDPKSSQFPVSLLKSATRFRVFMLRLKKPKSAQNQNKNTKSFVKFKVEEVPIVSLFKNPLKTQRSDDDLVEDRIKLSKETVQKYINKIKPRNGAKLKLSGKLTAVDGVVRKHLRKSKSASSAEAVAATSPPPAAVQLERRDDSLRQQEDGIQSAIAHCKSSLIKGSRSPLVRSKSDQTDVRS